MDVGPTYASVYPAVQNFVLAARSLGPRHGAHHRVPHPRGRGPRDLRHPRSLPGRGPAAARPSPRVVRRGAPGPRAPRPSPAGTATASVVRRPDLYARRMADWTTIASLATAGGTLVLALATFSSVRSAKRSTQVTERALLAGIRPVLVTTRMSDPTEKVGFIDQHWVKVDGQRAVLEATDEAIYISFTVRNVGAGIAVLDRWDLHTDDVMRDTPHRDPDSFIRLSRDLYIPAGDMGFWQGTFRDPSDRPVRRGAGGHRGSPAPACRPALRGSRGRSAHHQPVLHGPDGRRPVDHLGVAALEPRSRRPSLTLGC